MIVGKRIEPGLDIGEALCQQACEIGVDPPLVRYGRGHRSRPPRACAVPTPRAMPLRVRRELAHDVAMTRIPNQAGQLGHRVGDPGGHAG
jgi:hypothetical protein